MIALFENDLFKVVDDGTNYRIYQKRTDDTGQAYLGRMWMGSKVYTGEVTAVGPDLELLLITLIGQLQTQQAPVDLQLVKA